MTRSPVWDVDSRSFLNLRESKRSSDESDELVAVEHVDVEDGDGVLLGDLLEVKRGSVIRREIELGKGDLKLKGGKRKEREERM